MSVATLPYTPRAPFSAPTEAKLLGWVVAWSSRGVNITRDSLADALDRAGFSRDLARPLQPRHAWARACHELSEQRIIRLLAENKENLTFQFTREHRGVKFEYKPETEVTVDKISGKVTCEDEIIRGDAQRVLNEALVRRTGGDITQLIQRLFKRKADLFPIKRDGGVYFVPQRFETFVDTVKRFATEVQIEFNVFPIAEGSSAGGASVQAVIADGLASLIAEYDKAVDRFSIDTRQSTADKAADKIAKLRLKIDGYSSYLTDGVKDEVKELHSKIQQSNVKLRAAVEALGLTPQMETEGEVS